MEPLRSHLVHAALLLALGASCAPGHQERETVAAARAPIDAVPAGKLTPATLAAGDFYGTVAVSGAQAVTGAAAHGGSGAIYPFARSGDGWVADGGPFSGTGAASGDQFGYSVAIDGNTIVVGAPYHKSATMVAGAAYVFWKSGGVWTQQGGALWDSTGSNTDNFGISVAVSGDTLAVGAHHYKSAGTPAGKVYVYTRTANVWSLQWSKVGAAGDDLGRSVALSGDTLVVGAASEGVTGKAHVYARNGGAWSDQGTLSPPSTTSSVGFGQAVSVSGDTALVGAYDQIVGAVQSGAAYFFERTGVTWGQGAMVHAGDGAALDLFGVAVSISGDAAVVGASRHAHGSAAAGVAHVYERKGGAWLESGAELHDGAGAADDAFGNSVSVSGDAVLVGARAHDDVGADSGAVHAYFLRRSQGDPCGAAAECASGHCTDGVCCDEPCDGACDVCSAALGAPADGSCTTAPAGYAGTPACPNGYLCAGSADVCPTACSSDAGCAADHYCAKDQTCKPQKTDGSACDTEAGADCLKAGCRACESSHCVGGLCCDQACDQACEACSAAAKGSGQDGECGAIMNCELDGGPGGRGGAGGHGTGGHGTGGGPSGGTGGVGEHGSYYSCGVGRGPVSAGPVALLLVVARRRRRRSQPR